MIDPLQNQSEPPVTEPHSFRIVALFAAIGLVLVVGLGIVFPHIFSIANDVTQVPQDKIRQTFSTDSLAPSVIVSQIVPSSTIVWQPQLKVPFNIRTDPIFQQYGYDRTFIFQEKGFDVVNAVPNASSTLFAAETSGIDYNDQTKGYPVSSMLIFSKDLSFFKVMPLPKLSDGCCDAVAAWLGNRYILVNEFIPGIFPPGAGNFFYVGDTASSTANRIFEPITMPADLSNKHYINVTMFSHPDKNLAALSYCLTTVETDTGSYCSQSGFSIATPQRIVEVMTKNTRDSFKTGWDENNFYIQESSQSGTTTTYTFPLAQYENDKFTSTLNQHRDPTAHGTPAWIKSWIPIKQKTNVMSFEVNFDSTSTYALYSRGFLTVSLNDKPVAEVYEEQEPPGLHTKTFYFDPLPLGTSTLEIREDAMNPYVRSEIDIEHFGFGYATSTSFYR